MIEQSGRLTRTVGDRAWVRLGGQVGCPACDAGNGCGAGLFGRLLKRRPVELELDNEISARVGQIVTVGLPESLYLRLVWRAYGLPLLAGLAGATVSHQILKPWVSNGASLDVATLAGGVAVAILSWRLVIRRTVAYLGHSPLQLLAVTPGQSACVGRSTPET